ncbi:hypothetical protein ACLKA6_008722 [Drosophila palustris]
MENDDYQPLLRRRRNSYLKWTESKVLEFLELVLDLVKDVPESLEKPTAQKFYTKVMESGRSFAIIHCLSASISSRISSIRLVDEKLLSSSSLCRIQ